MPQAPNGFSIADAPGGDLGFDDLFADQTPIDPLTAAQTTDPAGVPPTQTLPEPQAPVAPAPTPFEIKTATGTVYKTVEDTVKGIEQKDTLIENLRSQLALRTGVDPITQQPLRFDPAPQPSAPQVPNYAQDAQKYMEDLVAAAESNDPARYAGVQQKFLLDTLAPISGIITDAAKKSAVEQIAGKYSDFNTVRATPEFSAVLEDNPELKEAIGMAESDYRFHNRLPGLYKIAYEAAQGRRVPELVRQQTAVVQTPTPQPARPTATSSPLPPPEPGVKPDIRTAEGRKAIIAQMEAQGVNSFKW
jgi:hypothetical protein